MPILLKFIAAKLVDVFTKKCLAELFSHYEFVRAGAGI